jgi:hypothetical protein
MVSDGAGLWLSAARTIGANKMQRYNIEVRIKEVPSAVNACRTQASSVFALILFRIHRVRQELK